MRPIVTLAEARRGYGGKAEKLAGLVAGGFDVPDGFAIAPDAPLAGMSAHLEALGDTPVAVRSSALGEDGVTTSFAGVYDSVIDVQGLAAVEDAVARVRASARSARALAYRADGEPAAMGVVVQRLVRAECAGVLFTADPVTGARDVCVVTAVPGFGEALVSGERDAEEWQVRGGRCVRRRALGEPVLTEAQARALESLGRRVEAHFGAPQDIEWVVEEGGRVRLVQARPITALPERVEWKPPHARSAWARNIRWGEWLTDPCSPLFASWFVPRASATHGALAADFLGFTPPPPTYGFVNGWYYLSPLGTGGVHTVLGGLLRRPGTMFRAARASRDPVAGAATYADPHLRAYEEELAPRHRAFAAEQIGDDDDAQIDYVDRACDLHGELMHSITLVGGYAWKVESALAKFFRRHCVDVEGAPHELLAALSPVEPCAAHHACSLDWIHATAGELGLAGRISPVRGDAAARRERLERACLEHLSPKQRRRFVALLDLARRYAEVRERQSRDLTLAWPNVRAALLRLGDRLAERGAIVDRDDVFWLRREEIAPGLAGRGRYSREVADRRRTWDRQRKLAPPLVIGELPGFIQSLFDALTQNLRGDAEASASAATLVGMPASAGRATGRVRLVLSPGDFGRLSSGEVLVAPTTAPAWTPLFENAVAVVTDGGSVAAHASLVAREYGIPAVVGTVDATHRLCDGQLVTVDGTAGRVEVLAKG